MIIDNQTRNDVRLWLESAIINVKNCKASRIEITRKKWEEIQSEQKNEASRMKSRVNSSHNRTSFLVWLSIIITVHSFIRSIWEISEN